MLYAVAAVAGFALGYTARCHRPLNRIDRWAWNQDHRRAADVRAGRTGPHPGWHVAQAWFAVKAAAGFVLAPRETVTVIREIRALRRQRGVTS
jgi:hypothetical protein